MRAIPNEKPNQTDSEQCDGQLDCVRYRVRLQLNQPLCTTNRSVRIGRAYPERITPTFGNGPFPRSLDSGLGQPLFLFLIQVYTATDTYQFAGQTAGSYAAGVKDLMCPGKTLVTLPQPQGTLSRSRMNNPVLYCAQLDIRRLKRQSFNNGNGFLGSKRGMYMNTSVCVPRVQVRCNRLLS